MKLPFNLYFYKFTTFKKEEKYIFTLSKAREVVASYTGVNMSLLRNMREQ